MFSRLWDWLKGRSENPALDEAQAAERLYPDERYGVIERATPIVKLGEGHIMGWGNNDAGQLG
jgi:hypothetical protein